MLGLFTSLLGLASLGAAAPQAIEKRAPEAFSTFTHNPVYYPLQQAPLWRTAYARALQLEDQSLIMTWEDYPFGEDADNLDTFKIIRSVDGGATWTNLSQVHDTQNGWGMRFQPHMYTLKSAFGNYPAGTLIIGGVSCPLSLEGGVYIDLYTSSDAGLTWTFASHMAYGEGPETVATGDAAIWEPFFLEYEGKLYMYYSDQRDPAHSQKLVLTSTTDLLNWSEPADVITHSEVEGRPGMIIISYIPTIDQYMCTYEYCNAPQGGCPAMFRLSADPTAFVSAADHNLTTTTGYQPAGAPYNIWYQYPNSSEGVIIASANSDSSVFISKDNAQTFTPLDIGQWAGHSRNLLLFNSNGVERLHVATGGFYGCEGSCYNFVANGVTDLDVFN